MPGRPRRALMVSGTAGFVVVGGGVATAWWWVVDRHERRIVSDFEIVASRRFLAQLNSSGNNDDQKAMRNLERYGVTIVRHVLNDEEVELWKQRVRRHCPCQPPPPKNNNNGTAMMIPPGTVHLDGRLHYHVAPTVPFHHELARLGGERWERGKRIRNGAPADKEATTASSSSSSSQLIRLIQRFFHQQNHGLTQLQLLNALPSSSSTTSHQIWHRDNTEPGLTAIVALTPITAYNGPTELIIGSHQQPSILLAMRRALLMDGGDDGTSGGGEKDEEDDDEEDNNNNNNNQASRITQLPESQHLLALLDAGDAILYDARCLHRGRGNNSIHHHHFVNGRSSSHSSNQNYDNNNDDTTIDEEEDHDRDHHPVDRPVLVLRWDADLTPPPGGGLIPTALARYGGYIYSLTLYGQAAYHWWKKQK
jgi:hypothetical protein